MLKKNTDVISGGCGGQCARSINHDGLSVVAGCDKADHQKYYKIKISHHKLLLGGESRVNDMYSISHHKL